MPSHWGLGGGDTTVQSIAGSCHCLLSPVLGHFPAEAAARSAGLEPWGCVACFSAKLPMVAFRYLLPGDLGPLPVRSSSVSWFGIVCRTSSMVMNWCYGILNQLQRPLAQGPHSFGDTFTTQVFLLLLTPIPIVVQYQSLPAPSVHPPRISPHSFGALLCSTLLWLGWLSCLVWPIL